MYILAFLIHWLVWPPCWHGCQNKMQAAHALTLLVLRPEHSGSSSVMVLSMYNKRVIVFNDDSTTFVISMSRNDGKWHGLSLIPAWICNISIKPYTTINPCVSHWNVWINIWRNLSSETERGISTTERRHDSEIIAPLLACRKGNQLLIELRLLSPRTNNSELWCVTSVQRLYL